MKIRKRVVWLPGAILVGISLGVASAASAAVNPNSGPVSGGTTVTFDALHFTKVAGGTSHALGLASDGTVWAWGTNSTGATGIGTLGGNLLVPYRLPSLVNVIDVAAGSGFSLAVTADGHVWAWGLGSSGQLGNSSANTQAAPVDIGAMNAVEVCAGDTFALARTAAGTVKSWGAGASGQIGDGTSTGRFTPATIPGLSGVSSIACGAAHAIAGLTDGTMRAWGNNLGGQLGVGSNVSAFTPVTVADANNVAVGGIQRVFAGAYNSFALTTAGQVFSWGWNANGQIGDGTTTQRQNPVLLSALTGVSALSSSGYNTLAVSAGQLWAWGENAQGQLGDGTISPSSIPKSINGVTGVTSVGSAARTSFLINSRGEIWSWGQTGSPQGNGASAAQLAPTVGPHFVTNAASFGNTAGTGLVTNGMAASVISPASSAGTVSLLATANVLGGTSPGMPLSVSWNAGSFSFLAASSGSSSPSTSASAGTTAGSMSNQAAEVPAALAATGVAPTVWALGLFALLCGSLALVAQPRRHRG